MKKLIAIAAMLLLPAVALGTTVIDYNDVVICTGFEDYDYGTIKYACDDKLQWGSRDLQEKTMIIDDPTGGGHGKVVGITETMAYGGGEDGKVRLYANRNDVPHPVTHPYGFTIIEFDMYLLSYFDPWAGENLFPHVGLMEWRPGQDHYYEADTQQITLWETSDHYAWANPFHPSLVTTPACAIPLDQWFTVKQVFNNYTETYEFYVNGVLLATDAPTYNVVDNQMVWEYYVLNLFLEEGEYYMYLDNVCWQYQIPEPSVLALGGLGLLTLLRRKKR